MINSSAATRRQAQMPIVMCIIPPQLPLQCLELRVA